MRKLIFTIAALFLMLFAYAQVAFASGTYGYQPKVPKSLKK